MTFVTAGCTYLQCLNRLSSRIIATPVSVVANFAKLSNDDQVLLLGKKEAPSRRHDRPEDLSETPNYLSAIDRLYQLIRSEKPYFEKRIDPRDFYRIFLVEPQQTPERIRAAIWLTAFLVYAERIS